MSFRICLGFLLATAVLPAQVQERPVRPDPTGEISEQEGSDVKPVEDGRRSKEAAQRAQEKEEEANLTPEQRLARHVTHGASAHCRFVTSMKPAKLMPGQTGTLTIAALLQGRAVIPATATLEMVATGQPGPYSLGAMQARPPENGRIEKGYLGRPVYENYLVVDVPVTMAAEAQVGKKTVVAVDLKFDLYDGTSAMPIGRFIDRATYEVEIGTAADPAVRGGSGTAQPVGDAPTVRATSTPTPVKPDAATKPDTLQGNVAPVADKVETAPVVPAKVEPSPAGDTMIEEEGLPPFLLVGGGAVLVVVLLLLFARKK
ncbi:MAG: hypothetical protein JNK15_11895 [Planctomycetes bacterium]|nr:hypothetical protein [Planctomycetota bacterium]